MLSTVKTLRDLMYLVVAGGGWWWIQELCNVSNQKLAPFKDGPRTTKVLPIICKNFSPSVDVKVDYHQFV